VTLEDEHWSVRCAAATALGRIGSSKAVPGLLARVDDPDATVRRAAVGALGDIRQPAAAGRLLAALGDPALQGAALEALRHLGASALPAMERAFAGGTLPAEPRRLLVDLASRLEDPATRGLLLAGLEDESAAVRAEAATALGDGGFREALRPLLEHRSTDPSPEVRQAAAGALRKLQPR